MDLDKNVPVLRARRTPPAKPVPKIARSRTGVRFDMRELMEQAKEQAAQLPLQKESSTDPIIPAGPLSSSSVGNRRVSSRKRTPKGK